MRILFILIFVYLIFSLLKRLVLVPFTKGYQNQRSNQGSNSKSPKREGEVSIEFDPQKSKSKEHSVGEYVDYEEVKE